ICDKLPLMGLGNYNLQYQCLYHHNGLFHIYFYMISNHQNYYYNIYKDIWCIVVYYYHKLAK
ncbi:hypothetical protein GLOIN_2v1656722, partial [Rhizophagus irregularis DAOM 181602=DAOM 197198]